MRIYSFNYLCTIVLGSFDINFAQTTLFWGFDVNLVFWRHFWRNVGIRGSPVKKTLFDDLMSYNISSLKFLSKNLLIAWIIAVFNKMTSFWVFNVVTSKYGPLHHKLGFYSFIYLFTFILRTLDTNLAKRRYFGVLTSIWCFDVIYWRNVGFRGSLIRRTLLNDFTSYNISFLKFLSKNLLISWIILPFFWIDVILGN